MAISKDELWDFILGQSNKDETQSVLDDLQHGSSAHELFEGVAQASSSALNVDWLALTAAVTKQDDENEAVKDLSDRVDAISQLESVEDQEANGPSDLRWTLRHHLETIVQFRGADVANTKLSAARRLLIDELYVHVFGNAVFEPRQMLSFYRIATDVLRQVTSEAAAKLGQGEQATAAFGGDETVLSYCGVSSHVFLRRNELLQRMKSEESLRELADIYVLSCFAGRSEKEIGQLLGGKDADEVADKLRSVVAIVDG